MTFRHLDEVNGPATMPVAPRKDLAMGAIEVGSRCSFVVWILAERLPELRWGDDLPPDEGLTVHAPPPVSVGTAARIKAADGVSREAGGRAVLNAQLRTSGASADRLAASPALTPFLKWPAHQGYVPRMRELLDRTAVDLEPVYRHLAAVGYAPDTVSTDPEPGRSERDAA